VPSELRRFPLAILGLTAFAALGAGQQLSAQQEAAAEYDYRLLATNRTSTMQKEMQEAAESGYAFVGVMGGDTSFGGSEVVVVMQRRPDSQPSSEVRRYSARRSAVMNRSSFLSATVTWSIQTFLSIGCLRQRRPLRCRTRFERPGPLDLCSLG